MENLIEKYLEKNNNTLKPVRFESIMDFAVEENKNLLTFKEYIIYDLLIDLKDIMFKKENYVCVYLGNESIKQLIKNINDIMWLIETNNLLEYMRKISKVVNGRFIFINKNDLLTKTKEMKEKVSSIIKEEGKMRRLSKIISIILNKSKKGAQYGNKQNLFKMSK